MKREAQRTARNTEEQKSLWGGGVGRPALASIKVYSKPHHENSVALIRARTALYKGTESQKQTGGRGDG
jgi:hypothetical protein